MAKFLFKKAETSVILIVFIQDSSLTTGLGLGSLDQTSSITGGYVKRDGTGVALAVDENVTTEGTYEAPTTAAQVRIGTPANMPTGFYELHFHNDLFTTADYVTIGLGGASNMAPLNLEVQLGNLDVNDGVRGGLTALPNAAADGVGGLVISDAGGLDIDAKLANTNEVTVARMGALTDLIDGGRLDLIFDATLADTANMQPKLGTISNLGGGATIGDNFVDIAGATFSTSTDSLEGIRDRGDAAWTTGAGTGLTALASGTAQSGTASTIVLASGEAFADDVLNGNIVKITSGTGAGQSRLIISNTLSDDTCNIAPDWTTNPDADSVYEIVEGAANIEAISLDNPAANNLESQYDTTGLVGDTFPASQSQLGLITNTSSAVNKLADSYVLTTGTQSSGTVSSTQALDGTNHEHTDTAGAMDLYYEFLLGSGIPASVTVTGYLNGNNDDLEIYGWDWNASAWVQIGTLSGKASAINEVNTYNLFVNMVGTGSDLGKVRVRFTDGAFTLTSATLAVDQIFVTFSVSTEGYENGAVWFDSSASNTNTTPGVDGLPSRPVSTMTAVNTLLASKNLSRIEVASGSTVTLDATQANQVFNGDNWILELGTQDISGTTFIGAGDVSGVGTGTSQIKFEDCKNIGTCTLHQFLMIKCGLDGTLTLGEAGNYILDNCYSAIAGETTPIIDTGAAIANVNLSMPDYHNGTEIRNLNNAGTDKFSISGIGQIIYAASSSGAVNQRGDWKVTNTGGVTITEDDNTANVAALVTTIGTLGAGLTDLGGMSDGMKAEVNVEVVDVIRTDTISELTSVPSASDDLYTMVQYIFQKVRNPETATSSAATISKADGTVISTAVLSDDTTTFTKAVHV